MGPGRAGGLHGQNAEFRIDYGRLLTVCAEGCAVDEARLYGSVPPANNPYAGKLNAKAHFSQRARTSSRRA
jgi:hypothetical protein